MSEKNHKQLLKEIKELTRETLESSSIHAVPNIARNKFYLVKLVWVICFMISAGWCCWFIQKSIVDYLSNDVVTKTDVKYVNTIIMPIISFCNINTFSTNYSNTFFINMFGTQYPDVSLNRDFAKIIANSGKYLNKSFDKNLKMNKLNAKSSDDELKNLIPVKNKGNLYPLNKSRI